MNGPSHYLCAEVRIREAYAAATPDDAAFLMAEAQVHATLALAAETLDSDSGEAVCSGALPRQWLKATR